MDKLLLVALVCVGGVSLASGASKHACYFETISTDRSAMRTQTQS